MRDFTLNTYESLLRALQKAGYCFITFEEYCQGVVGWKNPAQPFVILRHDVDKKPQNSVQTARIEHDLGVRASYYFRIVPESNQPGRIHAVTELGHEIGYHYEDMSLANGDTSVAMAHFRDSLAYFRQYYPVRTICMHGAPTSRYDGRDLWKKHDYHDEGIIGEPYFDVDFASCLYLTDTGRCFDGYKVSVRDKIPQYQDQWIAAGLTFHSSYDIIRFLEEKHGNQLPNIMLTTHPQRWTSSLLSWTRELVLQTVKNTIKRIIIKTKHV